MNPDTEWLQKAVQEWLKASEAYGLGNTCAEDRDDESSDTLGLNRQSTQHEHFAPMMQEISIHLEWGYILFQEMVRTAQAYMAVAAALKTDTPSGSGNRKRA